MRALVTAWILLALAAPIVAQPGRAVSLQATRNTRDLGGLPVQGGVVKKRMVYRSGALCFITPQDIEKVKGLKVKTILDLRNPPELARDGPDRPGLTKHVPNLVHLSMTNSKGLRQEAYHYYIRENPKVFQGFYKLLSDESKYPILFHCSAGKDRTGILAAVLLEQLGASRQTIMDDYLQSVRNSAGLEVHPEWIQEVFDYVDECGGVQKFLVKNGVSVETQARVKQLLVEEKP